MDVHNTVEDAVIPTVNEIFEAIEKEGNPDKYCDCNQCRMDTICYVLNRMPPHYILSNRGASRVQGKGLEHQQWLADMTALIHEGIRRVNHNQRPNVSHNREEDGSDAGNRFPVYNVPTIMGRIFDGNSFAPLSNVYVELLWNGQPVPMKDSNWQNPYRIVSNTEGAFSFWPAADRASAAGKHKTFEYTLRVTAPELETLTHFFKIPVASEMRTESSFNLARTFKLPDLYMFPPGEAEKNGE
jgi:competence protein ComFB